MNPKVPLFLCGCVLLLLAVLPVTASPILVTDSFMPNPPLAGGSEQQAEATFAIPSGTTFPKTHSLQLQTGLAEAQWTIQVILDGTNAARQTASGSAAFINGEILAYSVNHDVRFTVTIRGKVPALSAGTLTVLDMVEIDNSGAVVPGSRIQITQPVQGTPKVTSGIVLPTLTAPLSPSPTAPVTKSPGFSALIGIFGCCLALFVLVRSRQ